MYGNRPHRTPFAERLDRYRKQLNDAAATADSSARRQIDEKLKQIDFAEGLDRWAPSSQGKSPQSKPS